MTDSFSDIRSDIVSAARFTSGYQEIIRPVNPAAGTTFTRVIPPETWEQLTSLRFTLTTSIAVANRLVTIQYIDQDGNLLIEAQGSGAVVASSAITANLMVNGPTVDVAVAGNSFGFLPDRIMRSLYSWKIAVAGMDAADTLTGIVATIQRIPADVASGDRYLQALEAWRASIAG